MILYKRLETVPWSKVSPLLFKRIILDKVKL